MWAKVLGTPTGKRTTESISLISKLLQTLCAGSHGQKACVVLEDYSQRDPELIAVSLQFLALKSVNVKEYLLPRLHCCFHFACTSSFLGIAEKPRTKLVLVLLMLSYYNANIHLPSSYICGKALIII